MEPSQIHHWTRVLRRTQNGLHESEASNGKPSKLPSLR